MPQDFSKQTLAFHVIMKIRQFVKILRYSINAFIIQNGILQLSAPKSLPTTSSKTNIQTFVFKCLNRFLLNFNSQGHQTSD